jgi:hypothetical protein
MASNAMVPLAEDAHRALVGDIRDAHDAYRIMDSLETMAQDPTLALEAVAGMPLQSVCYEFRVAGTVVSGITVKGAKRLASARGGFEVLDPVVEQVTKTVSMADGTPDEVPAWKATVRVRDKRQDVTFVGICVEPAIMALKAGGTRVNEMAPQVAVSKATRNAILDHFVGVEDSIQRFIAEARTRNEVFVSGEADDAAQLVSDQIAAQRIKREARRQTPLGSMSANLFRAEVERTATEAGADVQKLTRDLMEFIARRWPGLKIAELPEIDKPALDDWLASKRRALGLDAPTETPPTQVPAAAPEQAPETPREPVPWGEHGPTTVGAWKAWCNEHDFGEHLQARILQEAISGQWSDDAAGDLEIVGETTRQLWEGTLTLADLAEVPEPEPEAAPAAKGKAQRLTPPPETKPLSMDGDQ